MIKTLRSLVLEKFPFDLRLKIELLSKRRDLINKEKQDEIFKLLREFNIDNIVPLGPGTNRYAFKLDGFVIKIATDNDGKIDNLKEFKMAKRLYPYVTKTYEVSENGTLLVAEYIQPFSSYGEMLNYADRIREILTKLSSVYLIGDVGITSKNYANWGVRIGDNEPVCLDFAYVYEVSSELFICRHCKSGSMLVPNKDFTELLCPYTGCGAKYLFEDIRTKLGNDLHRHDIGDLSDEGYKLSESNVITELSADRSNYLVRKTKMKPVNHNEKKEDIILDNFVMNDSDINKVNNNSKYKEDIKMLDLTKAAEDVMGRSINVFPSSVSVVKHGKKYNKHEHIDEQNKKEDKEFLRNFEESSLAFQADMDSVEEDTTVVDEIDYLPDELEIDTEEELSVDVVEEDQSTGVDSATLNNLQHNFRSKINNAFSMIAARVSTAMHISDLYGSIKNNLKNKKLFPEQFYKSIQNVIFTSLADFCGFTEETVENNNGKGYHKDYVAPDDITKKEFLPTILFISRIWYDRNLNQNEDPFDMLKSYNELFDDCRGFQQEWIPYMRVRLNKKIQADRNGIEKIEEFLINHFVHTDDEIDNLPDEISADIHEDNITPAVEEVVDESILGEIDNYPDEITADLSGEYSMNEEVVDESKSNVEFLEVNIYHEVEEDIIRLKSCDSYGSISIPFYGKLDEVDINGGLQSSIDSMNGIWGWLIHTTPDAMFKTKNPDEWLVVNSYPVEEDQAHIAVLEKEEDSFIMGIYYIKGIYSVDEEGNKTQITNTDTLAKLNRLILDDIGYNRISYLLRTLRMEELIRSEEEIKEFFTEIDIDNNESTAEDIAEESEEEFVDSSNDLEDAAIAALSGSVDVEKIYEPIRRK